MKDRERKDPYFNNKRDRRVSFGKYKEKTLKWVIDNDIDFFKQIKKLYYDSYNDSKKKAYDLLESQYLSTGFKTGDDSFQDRVSEVVFLLKEKKTNNEIDLFLRNDENYSFNYAKEIVLHARTLIRREFMLEREFLIDIHLLRYEEIYDNNINMNLDHIQPGYRNAVRAENYLTAMETLFQKERLLGIHSKRFKEQINKIGSSQNKSKLDFDVSLLKPEEQLELYKLLEKSKPKETIHRPVVDQEDQVDIIATKEKEVLQLDAPILSTKETDVIGDRDKNQVKTTGKSMVEVQEIVTKSIRDKVQEIYDRKFKK